MLVLYNGWVVAMVFETVHGIVELYWISSLLVCESLYTCHDLFTLSLRKTMTDHPTIRTNNWKWKTLHEVFVSLLFFLFLASPKPSLGATSFFHFFFFASYSSFSITDMPFFFSSSLFRLFVFFHFSTKFSISHSEFSLVQDYLVEYFSNDHFCYSALVSCAISISWNSLIRCDTIEETCLDALFFPVICYIVHISRWNCDNELKSKMVAPIDGPYQWAMRLGFCKHQLRRS